MVGYTSCKPADALVLLFVTPPYGSMEGYLVYCVFLFFVCTVTDFSAAERARGVKFCMHAAHYPDRSSPVLVKIGSRGVTGAVA